MQGWVLSGLQAPPAQRTGNSERRDLGGEPGPGHHILEARAISPPQHRLPGWPPAPSSYHSAPPTHACPEPVQRRAAGRLPAGPPSTHHPPREGAGLPPSSPWSSNLQLLSPSSLLPPLPSGVTVQHITRLCPRCDLAPLLPPFRPLPCSCSGRCISYSQYAFCRLSGCDPGSTGAPLNPLPESQAWNLQRRCPQPTLPPVGDPYCFWVGGGATPRRGGCPGSLAAQTK